MPVDKMGMIVDGARVTLLPVSNINALDAAFMDAELEALARGGNG